MPPQAPTLPPAERVRVAYQQRNESDYIANFWTAFGWSVLSCGIYSFYMFYQLVRRDRDHNRRRLELLDGATAHAWEIAGERGLQDELRPNFERLSGHLNTMRTMSTDFRDPTIWLLLSIIASSIVHIIAFVLMDGDLIKHSQAEQGLEAELSQIYSRLGQPLSAGTAQVKGAHNYVARIIVTIVTGFIYFFWWIADVMRDWNDHFQSNWAWEDQLAQAVVGTTAAA